MLLPQLGLQEPHMIPWYQAAILGVMTQPLLIKALLVFVACVCGPLPGFRAWDLQDSALASCSDLDIFA